MKSATEYLSINVPERMDFVNITSQVYPSECLSKLSASKQAWDR